MTSPPEVRTPLTLAGHCGSAFGDRRPQSLIQVFRMIEERPTHAVTVRVSYLEIYNESLFDLLSTLPYVGPSVTPVTIVENPQGVFIKGLSVHLTSQEEDAFSLLFEVR